MRVKPKKKKPPFLVILNITPVQVVEFLFLIRHEQNGDQRHRHRSGRPDSPQDWGYLKRGPVRDRWGVVAAPGFQALPDVLLFRQSELKLRSEDLNVLLQVLAHWYSTKELPYPTAKRIALRMGCSERTVERSLCRLRREGFLRKVKRKGVYGSKAYDPAPLVAKLTPYAEQLLKEQADRREEKEREELDRYMRNTGVV